ncbi:transglutaminase family protein [Roseococcus sp. YIM B11640]|uniref:transglutaminase family protein n=1 Tax=Roseococcus sp. YIM B11640 TaxID=3133973 RepID=UPI003C7DA281
MPHVHIVHTTGYRYRNPVGLTRHRLMVRPQDSHDLRLHEATLTVEPAPTATRWAHDVFGNSICFLEWDEAIRTQELKIVSTLDLTHFPAGPALPRATLDPAAEIFPFSYAADEVPDLSRLTERQTPDPERSVDAWARQFVAGEGEVRTLAMLEAMTMAVKANFTYGAREEEGTQTPAETLALGTGTCRDFALLMMEAARSLGLAARFVTGYLYDSTETDLKGGGATHAWCSIYLPGAGWVEFDPTNGLVAGANLIRVGVVRSPEQALPVAGGFIGDPADPLGLSVDVAVQAAPDEATQQAA